MTVSTYRGKAVESKWVNEKIIQCGLSIYSELPSLISNSEFSGYGIPEEPLHLTLVISLWHKSERSFFIFLFLCFVILIIFNSNFLELPILAKVLIWICSKIKKKNSFSSSLQISNGSLTLFCQGKKMLGTGYRVKSRMSPSCCNTAVVERMGQEKTTQNELAFRKQKIQLGFSLYFGRTWKLHPTHVCRDNALSQRTDQNHS